MDSTFIHSTDDLDALRNPTLRPIHIRDDSEGPMKVRARVARMLATWRQDTIEEIASEPAQRLPPDIRRDGVHSRA